MTTEQTLELATEHHRAGKLAEAETLYRQVLQEDPVNANALHRLGVLSMQRGDSVQACDLIGRAVARSPAAARVHCSLGDALAAVGRREDAIAAYQKAISVQPELAEAYFGLALVYQSSNRRAEAADAYRKVISLKPQHAEAHNNLGNALFGLGQIADAAASYERAVRIRSDWSDAWSNLGSAYQAMGQKEKAIAVFRRALELRPDSALIHNNLGNALASQMQFGEAIPLLRRALQLSPDFSQAAYNLANVLASQGQYTEAIELFRRAIAISPDYVDAHNNLGNALQAAGEYAPAAEAYLNALKLRPNFVAAYNNLGSALRTMSRCDEAIQAFSQALHLQPNYSRTHSNLGNVQKDVGLLDEAIAGYRRAIELDPKSWIAHANLVFTLQYHPDAAPADILREALRWNVLHAQPLANQIRPHRNDRTPDRRLRIGYIGADFRDHCQSAFTLPLLENHDKSQVEVFCYANLARPDAVTARIQKNVDGWRSIIGLPDPDVAEMIREDRIDILVDLTMHMANGRPLVLARKPAPIQVAWLAYPGTTGLSAIDYRISDPYLDPPGCDEAVYSERTVRLPETFWCYRPLAEAIDPGPLPALESGRITFGSLNNFCKVTHPSLEMWAQVLARIENSQLLLLAAEGEHRHRVWDFFGARNIDSSRIRFSEFQPRDRYLQLYRQIDLGLDTVPYNGHTTSLDALWMGVPFVTRIGSTVVGRAGLSQLCNLGLNDLVAKSDDDFMRIVFGLASDLPRLRELRKTLRTRMERSPLMDGPRFARSMEAAYRQMWTRFAP